MKKVTFLIILGLVFTFTLQPVLASSGFGLGYLSATVLGTKELRETVMEIVNVALGFLAVLAFVGIIVGGFMMITAGGSEEKSGTGKKAVAAGLIGLIIILSALAITNFIVSRLGEATGANF